MLYDIINSKINSPEKYFNLVLKYIEINLVKCTILTTSFGRMHNQSFHKKLF